MDNSDIVEMMQEIKEKINSGIVVGKVEYTMDFGTLSVSTIMSLN